MSKYITTTLPYVNSKPHIGHAFEFVVADVLARFFRLIDGKENVFFNTGIDEHGIKVQRSAQAANLPPQEYCDQLATTWLEFCQTFAISYDNFYRTSSQKHKDAVRKIFQKHFLNQQWCSRKSYEGKYCVGCESFITEKELVDNQCSIHSIDVENISEENWFFNLSFFRDRITDILVDKGLSPDLQNQIESFDEISITRKNIDWAVQLNESDSVYVWFDALLNYWLALEDNVSKAADFWADSIILCGRDNLRFQAYILQAMNLAMELPQNKNVLVHGMILDQAGKKISKTTGNVVDPLEQQEKFGISPLRWYLFGGSNVYNNFNYDEEALIQLWNVEIVDNIGNLFSRVLNLIEKKNIEIIPTSETNEIDVKLKDCLLKYDFFGFKQELLKFSTSLNKRISDEKPFSSECMNADQILSEIYQQLFLIGKYVSLLLPEYEQPIKNALAGKKKVLLFSKIQ